MSTHLSATQHAVVQSLLNEVDNGASLHTSLAANARKRRKEHTVFVAIVAIILLAGVAAAVLLGVRAVKGLDPGGGGGSGGHSLPPYDPSGGDTPNGGIPTTGPGSGMGCWTRYASFMPAGCKYGDPDGWQYEWNALDISTSQPPFQEPPNCGGSCGDVSDGASFQGTAAQQFLVCPPASVAGVTYASAPYSLKNPYPHPVTVQSLAFKPVHANSTTFSGGTDGVRTMKLPCYWNTQMVYDSAKKVWLPRPNASPAVIPPGQTVALSYGFRANDGSVVTKLKKGESAALSFVLPQCTNQGPFWKQVSAAYPPCKDTSPLAKALKWLDKAASTAAGLNPTWGAEWGGFQEVAHTVVHNPAMLGSKEGGEALQDMRRRLKTLQGIVAAAEAAEAETAVGAGARLSIWTGIAHDWGKVKEGLTKAGSWLDKQLCVCGDPLLPSNPGCPHFWDLHHTIAPTQARYFAATPRIVPAEPLPQRVDGGRRTLDQNPTSQSARDALLQVAGQLDGTTVAAFEAQERQQNAGVKFVQEPMWKPIQPQYTLGPTPTTWRADKGGFEPQLPNCSLAGETK